MLRRVTTTIDSLANIIQTLSQGGMSGQLIARRGSDISMEEGEIFFFHGKIVAAKAADRVGADALNWMNTWKDCPFSFHPSKESKHIPVLPLGILSNPTNALAMKNTDELRQISLVRKLEREKEKESESAKTPIVRPGALFPGAVPYRTEANDKALQLLKAAKYSRTHRHIFLLVNGRRSVVELIRLAGRDKEEVVKLLRDLEKLQIIHIPK
jgi:hypothetical protein